MFVNSHSRLLRTQTGTASLKVKNQHRGILHVDFSVLLLLKTCEIVHLNSWASSPNGRRKVPPPTFYFRFIYLRARECENEQRAGGRGTVRILKKIPEEHRA